MHGCTSFRGLAAKDSLAEDPRTDTRIHGLACSCKRLPGGRALDEVQRHLLTQPPNQAFIRQRKYQPWLAGCRRCRLVLRKIVLASAPSAEIGPLHGSQPHTTAQKPPPCESSLPSGVGSNIGVFALSLHEVDCLRRSCHSPSHRGGGSQSRLTLSTFTLAPSLCSC